MSASVEARRPWLFGPLPDLLFGCGLLWMAVFVMRAVQGPDFAAFVPGALLIMLFAVPHYGATLVLVYESPESRRRYTVFSVWVSLLLALVFAASVRSPLLGSLVLTVYLTWSPWHYTGQNYGIFLALLGRRGVRPDKGLKRAIHVSFIASYVLTFLSIHGSVAATYAPVSYAGSVYRLMPIGVPETLATGLIAVASLVYLACVGTTIVGLLRAGSLSAVAPAFALLVTQALWFSAPAFIRQWRMVSESSAPLELYSAYAFLWIAAAHSIQYLWFCTYYATGGVSLQRIASYLGKCVLGGYAIWILPGVIFAPGLLGSLPAEAGLTLMVAAIVNMHHFVLDGVIWKLRDGRIARILFGGTSSGAQPQAAEGRARGFRTTLVVGGGLAFAVVGINHYESEYGFRRSLEAGDLERAELAARRLAWIGNDSPQRRTQLGRRMAGEGDLDRAWSQFRRSLALQPTAGAWRSVAQLHEQSERWPDAQAAYRKALSLDADHVPSLIGSGSLWIRLGRSDRALPLLKRASKLAPYEPTLQEPLARARRDMQEGV